jgi:sugar O-acyltransferase (sialic acid O-acetyltransferase NeuD family)
MKLALIGNGGHAREVMSQMNLGNMTRFVDDEYWDNSDEHVKPISSLDIGEYSVMIAVGDSVDRMNIANRLPKETSFFSFTHPTAQIMSDSVEIGEGSFIGAGSILTCDIKIGNHAILNRGVQIGHDCFIEDFFSAMPGAIVSGGVVIKDCVYMGTNSTIIENLYIAGDVKIGAGACVVSGIGSPGIYVGVPAKLKK